MYSKYEKRDLQLFSLFYNVLFVSSFLLFAIFLHLVFLLLIRFLILYLRVTDLRKKQEIYSKKYNWNKTVAKQLKAKGKKQETVNKKHIVE